MVDIYKANLVKQVKVPRRRHLQGKSCSTAIVGGSQSDNGIYYCIAADN